jgi:hypothetical protein
MAGGPSELGAGFTSFERVQRRQLPALLVVARVGQSGPSDLGTDFTSFEPERVQRWQLSALLVVAREG